MSAQFDLPRIDGANADERFAQIQSYLWQFVEKMNYILNYLDTDEASGGGTVLQTTSGGYSGTGGETANEVTDNGWLIRTSADGFKEAYAVEEINGDAGPSNLWPSHSKRLPSSLSESKIVAMNAAFFGNDYLSVNMYRPFAGVVSYKLSGQYHVDAVGKVYLYIACKA